MGEVVLECDGIEKALEGLECEDVKIWNTNLEFNKDIIYIISPSAETKPLRDFLFLRSRARNT